MRRWGLRHRWTGHIEHRFWTRRGAERYRGKDETLPPNCPTSDMRVARSSYLTVERIGGKR